MKDAELKALAKGLRRATGEAPQQAGPAYGRTRQYGWDGQPDGEITEYQIEHAKTKLSHKPRCCPPHPYGRKHMG